jgi:hypothetical protein
MDVKRFGLGLDRNDKWLAATRAAEKLGKTLETVAPSPPRTRSSPTTRRATRRRAARLARPAHRGRAAHRVAHPRGEAPPQAGRAQPGAALLHPLRPEDGLDGRADLRADRIDPFFLDQLAQIVEFEDTLCGYASLDDVPAEVLFEAKAMGFSDAQLANLYLGTISSETILEVRRRRESLGVSPVFKCVDTCAAEFEAITPYYYSTYERGWTEIDDAGNSVEFRPRTRSRATLEGRRSSSSAAAPTASGRASSSTTAACTRPSRPRTSGTSR